MNPSNSATNGLHAAFQTAAAAYPDRPALDAAGQTLSYAQLNKLALQLAALLLSANGVHRPRVGVLASRSIPAYTAILGTLMAGGVVVPLNSTFPVERTAQMIELAQVSSLVVDDAALPALERLLDRLQQSLAIIVAPEIVADLQARWSNHRFFAVRAFDASVEFRPQGVAPDDLAYLFFTSGSTGTPKGVGVLHRNAGRFVDMSVERYRTLGVCETDRFSQFYDITFDSSMFDIFVSWAFGACLCSPSAIEWVNPNKYIENKALTVIDIVPSMGHAMSQRGGWRAGRFDRLKLCRFGGEALPAALAQALADAAPKAAIDNVYGPTECTVDAAYYRWDPKASIKEALHGVVPIGVAGPRVGLRVVDADLREVPVGGEGELLISGPQVTPGYWNDPDRTAKSFVRLPGSDIVHYRTGDLVRRVPEGEPIPYLGRMDYQIKIAGVRIELGEVEHALRRVSGTDMAVAVGWPPTLSGASGIVAFVASADADGSAIRHRLKDSLPSVMVPSRVHVIAQMPLNVNGKVDRKALLERLTRDAGTA